MAALALTACPSGKKCDTNADCTGGEVCSVMSGTCVTGMGGGIGGGLGGGVGGGAEGGGAGGGGGSSGGGTGGGAGGTGGGGGDSDGGVNGGDTCEMATTITAGTIMGSTVGGMNDYDPGCTGDVTPGPDSVYRISVPAGQRLTVTATPEQATSGNQFDLAVYLIEASATACDANQDGGIACVSASDDPQFIEVPETASYFNASNDPVDIFIVVDSYFDMMNDNPDGGIGVSNEGNFELVAVIAPPSAGDRCDTAQALTSGTAVMNQDLADYGDDYDGLGAGCEGSTSADVTYSINVGAGQLLSVEVTPSMGFDPTISITDGAAACGTTCIASIDVAASGGIERLNYRNDTGAAQTIFIVVDGYFGSTGTFSILANVVTPAADDVCAAPTALTPGTALTAQAIANYSNDYTSGTNCGFSSGGDRVYSVDVPNGQRLTVTATPTPLANPSLSLIDGEANCGTACLASATAGGTGQVETLSFTNRSGATQSYLLVVDFSATSTGTFDLLATVATPPADDVCEMPTVLTAGTPATGTTVGYTNDYQNGTGTIGCSDTGYLGFDRVYQVSIPANQRGVVTVTPTADAGYNPSINLVEGAASVCSAMPRVCAAGSNIAGANAPESVSIFNTTGAAKSFFAIVDSSSGGGEFSINYTASTPAADDTCTTAGTAITAGTLTGQNMTGFENDYPSGIGCAPSSGPDRVYRVNLAANEKYTFTATPTDADGGFDPVVNFIPGPASNCETGARTCRGGADSTLRSQAETGSFTNNSGGALEVFVIISDYETDSTNRDFTLTSAIAPAPAGETCAVPLAATAGMLTGQSTNGASADVVFATTATGCEPTGIAPDRVYAVTIPAGQTLTVTATPALDEDLIVNIIDGAASVCNNVMMCADSSDFGFEGEEETVSMMNTTAAPKTVFVQVAGWGFSLDYSLNVQIQ